MADQKYKITMKDLETRGGIARLEHDKFTREAIHKQMYRVMDGASQQEITKTVANLYKRKEPC